MCVCIWEKRASNPPSTNNLFFVNFFYGFSHNNVVEFCLKVHCLKKLCRNCMTSTLKSIFHLGKNFHTERSCYFLISLLIVAPPIYWSWRYKVGYERMLLSISFRCFRVYLPRANETEHYATMKKQIKAHRLNKTDPTKSNQDQP